MRTRIVALVVAGVLLALAYVTPGLRRRFIRDIITWDAPATDPVALPPATGKGLTPAERVRVILIDGLGAQAAQRLPTWQGLCERGVRLRVDVGFPTVSLPIQVSLWTGLTQQQTGVVFRSDRPLVPPLDRRGLPARVLGSHAVAESHGYIVRSLGFQITEPHAAVGSPPLTSALPPEALRGLAMPDLAKDLDPEAWKLAWQDRALAAVTSDARLAFVHVLRVDTWGHRKGQDSVEYATAAAQADALLARLVAAAPGARWFLLSDHGHLSGGGHGGEDRSVRQVEHCIVGPDIAPANGGSLVHLVDVSRAIADSLALSLDHRSVGRPLQGALAAPLADDQAVPALPLGRGVAGVILLALGLGATLWGARRWWLAPWWFVVACGLLILVRGFPTMSMPMVYGREDITDLLDLSRRLMTRTWLVALPIAAGATWFGLARVSVARVLASQLAVPVTALAAVITACAGWGPLLGAEASPMVPLYTALTSVLMLIVAHGSAAVALGLLVRTALSWSGRSRPAETPRTEP
jgi:hypothetical protein